MPPKRPTWYSITILFCRHSNWANGKNRNVLQGTAWNIICAYTCILEKMPLVSKPGKSFYPLPPDKKLWAPDTRPRMLGSRRDLDQCVRPGFMCPSIYLIFCRKEVCTKRKVGKHTYTYIFICAYTDFRYLLTCRIELVVTVVCVFVVDILRLSGSNNIGSAFELANVEAHATYWLSDNIQYNTIRPRNMSTHTSVRRLDTTLLRYVCSACSRRRGRRWPSRSAWPSPRTSSRLDPLATSTTVTRRMSRSSLDSSTRRCRTTSSDRYTHYYTNTAVESVRVRM